MPKVTLTARQRRANALAGIVIGSMREYGVTHDEIADALGISKTTLCRRLNDGEFTVPQIATLASKLHWSDAEFFKIFKREE